MCSDKWLVFKIKEVLIFIKHTAVINTGDVPGCIVTLNKGAVFILIGLHVEVVAGARRYHRAS